MAEQVYTATHDGEGNLLPVIQRQFISFSWGGKNIEDFDLLSVFQKNGLNKQLGPSFTDMVSNYDGVDGQNFWGSTINATSFSFDLATDGMTSKQLEEFKAWFQPGIARDLILTEYPTRAIAVRIKEPPTIQMIPFSSEQTVKINNVSRSFVTTLYRGTIALTFVADNSYWYSTVAYYTANTDSGASTIYKKVANEDVGASTAQTASAVDDSISIKDIYEGNTPAKEQLKHSCFVGGGYYWDGSTMNVNGSSSLTYSSTSTPATYLYNCGTAPSKPIFSFSGTAIFDSTTKYITFPRNTSYANNSWSFIQVGDKKFYFTTPSYFSSYNEAIYVVNQSLNKSVLETKQTLREKLLNKTMRTTAITYLTTVASSNLLMTQTIINNFCAGLQNQIYTNFSMSFDSQKSEATVTYINGGTSWSESCGDCIKSQMLMIADTNVPDSNGLINTAQMTPIYISDSINNFRLNFIYMYD